MTAKYKVVCENWPMQTLTKRVLGTNVITDFSFSSLGMVAENQRNIYASKLLVQHL